MKEEKIQLGDVIKSSAVGKTFRNQDLFITFKENEIEIKFKDVLGLEVKHIPYTELFC